MPKTNTMTLRVSDELKAKLDRYAQLTGRSMSYVAATAVEEYLAWRVPQLEDLEIAIQEADEGKIAAREEVEAMKEKWSYARGWMVGPCAPLARHNRRIHREGQPGTRGFLHRELFQRVDGLARFPHMGRPSEKPDVREVVIKTHYRVLPHQPAESDRASNLACRPESQRIE
ncbi:MAG: hypothetical protein WKH97_18170 [Casimicrobiaceae bacterium]